MLIPPPGGAYYIPTTLPFPGECKTSREAAAQADSIVLSSDAPCEKEWTILVYNAGSSSDSRKCTASLLDMEKAGSGEGTNLVVMNYRSPNFLEKCTGRNRRFRGASTYYVVKNQETSPGSPLLSRVLNKELMSQVDFWRVSPRHIHSPVIEAHPENTDMADRETLRSFILENMKKFPARHYAVIINGRAIVPEGTQMVETPEGQITDRELAGALKDVASEIKRPIDLVDINTPCGANLSLLHALEKSARTVVASEGRVYGGTQPFSRICADLEESIGEGRPLSHRELATLIVEESRRQPLGNLYTKTLSAFDMEKLQELETAVKSFNQALENGELSEAALKKALKESSTWHYSAFPEKISMLDIGSLAARLAASSDSKNLQAASLELKRALDACVIAEQHARSEAESLAGKVLRKVLREDSDGPDICGLAVRYEKNGRPNHPFTLLLPDTTEEQENPGKSPGAGTREKELSPAHRIFNQLRLSYKKMKQFILRHTGVHPQIYSYAERMAFATGMCASMACLNSLSIPVTLLFGCFLTAKGVTNICRGFKGVLAVEKNRENRGTREKRELAGHGSRAVLGITSGAIGLRLLGFLPTGIGLPVALTALAIKGVKEAAGLWLSRGEHEKFNRENERFSRLTVSEKLEYLKR